MTIRIPVKPIFIEKRAVGLGFATEYRGFKTKDELLSHITHSFGVHRNLSNSDFGTAYQAVPYRMGDKPKVLGINLEKRNRKTVQTRFKAGPKKGQTKISQVVTESHWVAWVYRLENLPVKVKQHSRHFTFELR